MVLDKEAEALEKILLKEIEKHKEILITIGSEKGLQNSETIRKSQYVDELITLYQRSRVANQKHPVLVKTNNFRL
jgi:16S rRNA U1498 N3-methylase RsmE